MFFFTLKEIDLLLDCVTQSRGFHDFERRGAEDLQEKIMNVKNEMVKAQDLRICLPSAFLTITPKERKK